MMLFAAIERSHGDKVLTERHTAPSTVMAVTFRKAQKVTVSELVNQSRAFPVPVYRKENPVLTVSDSPCLLLSSRTEGMQRE